MAKNQDDDAAPDDVDSGPVEPKAKASPGKPANPAAEKRVKPAADKDAKASPAKPGKPAKPAAEKAPKAPAETRVQTEAAAKKKKPKAETGIATKPGRFGFNFSKAAPVGVWGVDLGQCALKAVRLEVIDGEVAATAFDYVEHPKILSQPDADPDELTREALAKFLSRNTLRGDTVAISVPGQSGLARFVKLPPVEEKKIPDIVKFEAKQQIPFNLDEVVWDYQKLGGQELTAGFVETEIGLFAMKRDMVTRYLQHFKEVGVEVHLVQMAPLALCNFVAYDLLGREANSPDDGEAKLGGGKKRSIVALDIGADSSNLVITDGARIIWQRPIPLGGNHFTRALTKDLKLTFAKAEHLKRNAVKSPDLKKILASLKPVLGDFVGEVQRSLGYFTNTHRDAQIEYMIGLGNAFRLPGLQRFLAEKLQMEVRKLGKMERLTGDAVVSAAAYTENILSFSVAYGLALQGLKKTRLQTNLLPGEIRAERAVRGKKPWAVAAAALLMIGLGGLGFSYYLGFQAYGAPVVAQAETKANNDAKTAAANEKKFTDIQAAALKEEDAVKSIIAGQAERKNWLELTHYLFNVALPNPDGSNLSAAAKREYMDKAPDLGKRKTGQPMTGQQAYVEWVNRQKGVGAAGAKDAPPSKDAASTDKPAAPGGGDDLGAGIDDLVQTNIDYFDQRFCDDLGAFWEQVKKNDKAVDLTDSDSLRQFVRSADPAKPPEGKGWVVEVHGYTFNQKGKVFIADTLMDNLYRLSVRPAPAGPPAVAPMGAVPTSPAGTPAAPAPKPSDKDAYLDKISHVVLYNALSTQTSDTNSFNIVGQSVLDPLVKSGAVQGVNGTNLPGGSLPGGSLPGGSLPSPGGVNAPAGDSVSRDSWRPLSPAMGGGAAPNGAFGQPPAASNVGMPDFGRPRVAAGGPSGHTRTEFVILFIWKEPTPSDSLRGEDDKAVAANPAAPAGFPAPGRFPGAPAGSMTPPAGSH